MLWGTWQQVFSASAFVACVTPMAPGVKEVMLASEPEPDTHMIESNVTGIANAARKIPVTTSFESQARNEGRNTHSMYFFGCERMTPPCFAWAQSTAVNYSTAQQLITTAWNVLFALILVVLVFGWTGGKELVGTSYGQAKDKAAEMKAERKRKRLEKREAKRQARAS